MTVPCNLRCVYAKNACRPYCFGQHRFHHKRQNTKTHTWQARISPHMLRTTLEIAGTLQLSYTLCIQLYNTLWKSSIKKNKRTPLEKILHFGWWGKEDQTTASRRYPPATFVINLAKWLVWSVEQMRKPCRFDMQDFCGTVRQTTICQYPWCNKLHL